MLAKAQIFLFCCNLEHKINTGHHLSSPYFYYCVVKLWHWFSQHGIPQDWAYSTLCSHITLNRVIIHLHACLLHCIMSFSKQMHVSSILACSRECVLHTGVHEECFLNINERINGYSLNVYWMHEWINE